MSADDARRRTTRSRGIAAATLLSALMSAARADDDAAPAPPPAPAAAAVVEAAAPDPWADKVRAVVDAAGKDDSEAAVAARIGALGPHAIPAVFAIYRQVDGDFRAPVKRSTLLASFREFASADVAAFLAATIDENTPQDALIDAMQVAAAVAGRDCTKVVLSAAFRLPPIELRRPAAGGAVRGAVAAALVGDPDGWRELRLAWPALDPSLRRVVVLSVEDTRSTDGLRFFAGLLGRDRAANVETLRHMCRMPRLVPRPLPDDVVQSIRWMTKDGTPEVRVAAILFLGLVHDSSAFGLALALLSDTDADVVDVALATLRRTSGAALTADAEAWTQWRLADDAWREKRLEDDLAMLGSKDGAVVADTLRALGARRLHVKSVSNPIATFLASDDPALRRAACEALGSLEDAGHVAALVAALSDEDAGVVQAAGAALVAVTGLRLPADAAAWRGVVR